MAMPENILSLEVLDGTFLGGRALAVSNTHDYELGGIALNDPSQGHQYQIWEAVIENKTDIVISAEEVDPFIIYTGNDITEVSISFDQNMRPAIAFVEGGSAKFRWYDTQLSAQTITDFGPEYKTPRVSLDDKRRLQMALNDVILAYIRGGNLYHRLQRDRYTIEYLLQENIQSSGLIKIGMNRVNRFQFLMRY